MRWSSRRSRSPTPTPSARARSPAADYLAKFRTLATGVLDDAEIERFLDTAQRLGSLRPDELGGLTVVAPGHLLDAVRTPEGLF